MEAEQEQFCAHLAREGGDPLLGTATQVKVWLLLEYREPWRAKATTDNDLPARVQSYLTEQLAAIPDSRLLFIKQQNPAQAKLRFFVVRTDEAAPEIDEFELGAYEELLALPISAVAAGDDSSSSQPRQEPLFLVCTNGRRDKCCAKFGLPLYKALLDYVAESTWQASHIGGHRYAPNVLVLPHSVNYGHLTPAEIGAVVDAYLKGQLYDLDSYRGRTYYAPHVQAADTFLRRELGHLDLTGMQLRSTELVEEDTWRVQFILTATGETHEIVLHSHKTEQPRLISCSSPAIKAAPRYQLLDHKIV